MPKLISHKDVDRVFSDTAVVEMAKHCRLPRGLDCGLLASGIRDAVRLYLDAIQVPNANRLHREIKRLHDLAQRRNHDELAQALTSLSPAARDLLINRARGRNPVVSLPDASALLAFGAREAACTIVASLCSAGAKVVPGRNRPSGRRSRPVLRYELHAPAPTPQFRKRTAERELLMWLRVAWFEASAKMPPWTADRRKLGPFARLVQRCLHDLGMPHVNVAELINSVDRPALQRPRW